MAIKNYSCDFETTTFEPAFVWLFSINEIGGTFKKIGRTIDEFMEWCFSGKSKKLYFHNLKFDGEFIISWLFKNNYKYDEKLTHNSFSTIVSDTGIFYKITIVFDGNKRNKKKIEIFDSLKKLPFKVSQIAKDFHLPIKKTSINYDKYIPIDEELPNDYIEYVDNDSNIIAMALDIQLKQGLTSMTNGADALKDFKKTIGKRFFEANFPILDEKTDNDIRKSYRGGFVYVNPRYAEKDIGKGIVFDVNSLFPSQMYYRPLPIGIPKYFKGKYKDDSVYNLYISHIKVDFKLKNNYIPTIQDKKSFIFSSTEYITDTHGELIELFLTSVDIELMFKHYDIMQIEYIDGYKFMSTTGIFKPYIDKWMNIKENSVGAIRQLAKLMLNSLYGKFGTNTDCTRKIPYFEDGIVKWKKGKTEKRDSVYVALASFVTSWARYTTISTAQKCYDRFIYADTDSLHLIGTDIPEAIKDIVHESHLGYWKHESTFAKARFLRAKTYIEFEIINEDKFNKMNDEWKESNTTRNPYLYKEGENYLYMNVKCAGMTNEIKNTVTYDNFKFGFSRESGKLRPKHVKGGILLVDTPFNIRK